MVRYGGECDLDSRAAAYVADSRCMQSNFWIKKDAIARGSRKGKVAMIEGVEWLGRKTGG
jgi:hypothetical protein